jgi:hypothetical protein
MVFPVFHTPCSLRRTMCLALEKYIEYQSKTILWRTSNIKVRLDLYKEGRMILLKFLNKKNYIITLFEPLQLHITQTIKTKFLNVVYKILIRPF